jgi:hypothetical protein
MLFDHDSSHTVVKSSNHGLFQHDVYSWKIMGGNLVSIEGRSKSSLFIGNTIKDWLNSLDKKQRRDFIEVLYSILHSTEARTFPEIGTDWLKNSRAILHSITHIDPQAKDMMIQTLKILFKAAKKNISVLLP